jgi:glycerate 2-kinase
MDRIMKILIAPNSFKDSLSAIEISTILTRKISDLIPDAKIVQLPVADGGDGLIDIALHAMDGRRIQCPVHDPLDRKITADFCFVPERKLAIIEMASASGLRLLSPSERNPMKTSTKGTGELIKAALGLGVKKILIGLGGSATNDGGCGMAAALGTVFQDSLGAIIAPRGDRLTDIATIDTSKTDSRLKQITIEAMCDVSNPLLGDKGASAIYGPQKGASPDEIQHLEAGLENLANRIETDLKIDVTNMEFSGAAGGLGAGVHAFLGATLGLGIDVVLNLININQALEGCDLVITGEGKLDEQTVFGKAPAGVAARAAKINIPCFAISGSRGPTLPILHEAGFSAMFSICPGPVSLQNALENAESYLEEAAEQMLRCYLAGRTGENGLDSLTMK